MSGTPLSSRAGRHARRPVAPDHAAGILGRLGDFAVRRRWLVVAAWLIAIAGTIGLSAAAGGEFKADYTAPGSSSRQAQDLLAERFPARSGEVIDVVVRADGGVAAADVRSDVQALLGRFAEVEHVRGVEDPYAVPGAIAQDGKTLLAHVQLDVLVPEDMPVE